MATLTLTPSGDPNTPGVALVKHFDLYQKSFSQLFATVHELNTNSPTSASGMVRRREASALLCHRMREGGCEHLELGSLTIHRDGYTLLCHPSSVPYPWQGNGNGPAPLWEFEIPPDLIANVGKIRQIILTYT